MKARDIVKAVNGKLLSGSPDADIDPSMISTDSRAVGKGGFFIALKGPNFNGNDFVRDATKKGAAGALVSDRDLSDAPRGKIIILAGDTTKALQDIAAAHRGRFSIPIIAVTGSNGKTTVKDMIWTVLSKKYNVLKNEGTHNNHIGVPQTLLKLKPSHDICVLELGTNHKGEIAALAKMARPAFAVVTNIGPSHLQYFRNLEGVFKAKMELLDFLEKKGVLIVNGDDECLSGIKDNRFRMTRYGMSKSNDLRAEVVSLDKTRTDFTMNNEAAFGLNVLGVHNVYNALAAIAVAYCFGIGRNSAREALEGFKPAGMRLDMKNIRGVDVINDSYNSNPLSMKCALETIKNYPAKAKWVVSGDMLELGDEGVDLHKGIGSYIAKSGVDGLLTYGKLSKHTLDQARKSGMRRDRLWHCSSHDEIARILQTIVKKGDAVLLKGSRSMKMEEVLNRMKM
ncbi:MAG: UDP-N-acetylmuramoyl-tripeptide--D-alanyl-D-alanine ligase [Candidatus Omnitrophica bacterium]|nr:UDP-N-acetylmuramoyl-tripeptide--D-alanyl-D-alanine ligase [Candidatus Omnitrophota bacterium]